MIKLKGFNNKKKTLNGFNNYIESLIISQHDFHNHSFHVS